MKISPIVKTPICPIVKLDAERIVPIISDKTIRNIPMRWAGGFLPLTPVRPADQIPCFVQNNPPQMDYTTGYHGQFDIVNGLAYWDSEKVDYVQICNYSPYINRVLTIVSKDRPDECRIECMVVVDGRHRDLKMQLRSEDLSAMHTVIKKWFPDAHLEMPKSKAELLIDKYISELIKRFKPVRIYVNAGWQMADGRMMFLHDGKMLRDGECHCGKAIVPSTSDKGQPLQRALDFLQTSNPLEKSLIPFLFAHLALLQTLFEDAGFPSQFLIFVNGTTGSLKTAICKVLFHIFNNEPPKI